MFKPFDCLHLIVMFVTIVLINTYRRNSLDVKIFSKNHKIIIDIFVY
jgi:uncharacterized membrane protein